jgi:hypothetical protein
MHPTGCKRCAERATVSGVYLVSTELDRCKRCAEWVVLRNLSQHIPFRTFKSFCKVTFFLHAQHTYPMFITERRRRKAGARQHAPVDPERDYAPFACDEADAWASLSFGTQLSGATTREATPPTSSELLDRDESEASTVRNALGSFSNLRVNLQRRSQRGVWR